VKLKGAALAGLARTLAAGETSGRALTEEALEAIADDPKAFLRVDAERARAQAEAADQGRAAGRPASPLAGIPVSVKALFDVKGEVTTAGSSVLASAAPAKADAAVVARLRRAGLVVIGVTHTSEFAFTGLGLNPHFPQPPNPLDPSRVPGGSSSGAAVSVAFGQAAAALGTDTGGSVRIPAAFCGLVGFKPSQRRVSRRGVFPLSASLDSVGPIANSAACCAALDAIIADRSPRIRPPSTLANLRLGVPDTYLLDDLDPAIARAFDTALRRLSAAGARIEPTALPELSRIPKINARGSISNAEAFALHRRLGLLAERHRYDPNVLPRVELGGEMSAGDYLDLLAARGELIRSVSARTRRYDALLAPTTPISAPRIDAVSQPAEFARLNGLALRNPAVVNLLDGCAISLPIATDGALPAGLMLIGGILSDSHLLSLAEAIEPVVR
jgi:aspartyl-tRNA(Asn)/glutamyl-tRNA(Gln) amidotransferase subunit A